MNFTHTNLPVETELPKLVRDKILDHIRNNNKVEPKYHVAKDDEEFLSFMLKKVYEESVEIKNSKNIENLKEELADLKELIVKIMSTLNITDSEIDEIRKEKVAKNGAFDKRYILEAK